MAAPDKAAVLEAMRSDLGVRRVDDLDLANGRPGSSSRPGQVGHIVKVAPPPPKKVLPIANKWKDAIARGEFDDEDADAVKGLDRIGGGRLHAQNKPEKAPMFPPSNNFGMRPKGYTPTFSMGAPSTRMPGAYPPTPERSVRGAPAGPYNSQRHSPGMSSMGVVLNGPVRRFEPGNSPARQSAQNAQPQPPPMRNFQTTPIKPPGARPPQHQPNTLSSPMLPTPPRDVAPKAQKVLTGFISFLQTPDLVLTEEPTRPKDPEPLEYVHKADIRVGDRLAKGQGTVYLLESSPTDPGTISIYLEGYKYLEYPVLSMYNYITNSEELCPQFKEPDGVSITTTSLVFGSQDKIVNFMKVLRTMKARKSSSSSAPASIAKPQKSTTPKDDAAGGSLPQQHIASIVHTEGAIDDGKRNDTKNGPANMNKNDSQPTTIAAKHPQSPPHPKQPDGPKNQTVDEKLPTQEAPINAPSCEVTTDLLDLSLPAQAPSGKVTHASQYALDLGSLEPPVCDSVEPEEEVTEKAEAQVSPADDTPIEANGPPPSEEGAADSPNAQNALVVVDQDVNQMTHDELITAIEDLREYLLSILPTFEDMCRVLVSIDAEDRQTVARTVYSSIRNSSNNNVAESEASAKQVLLALISQAGNLEKRKTIEPSRPDNRTRYTPEEILQLRTKALPPPPQLSKFARMLRAENHVTPHPAPTSKTNAQNRVQNINPKTNSVAPPPHTQGHERGASSQSNVIKAPTSRAQTKRFNPEAPVFTNTNNNIENITAALAAVSLAAMPTATPANGVPAASSAPKPLQENTKPEPPAGKRVQKGLGGSRWADGSAILPTNASRFTGINIP